MEFSDAELEVRVRAGLRGEIELFGSASPSARVVRLGGVIASVSPPTPDRSLFNSVYAADPSELSSLVGDLESIFGEAGIRAWTVWLPADHPAGPGLLAPRGHILDGSPRSMGLALAGLRVPERSLPEGVELRTTHDLAEIGAVNDAAYGLEAVWATALSGEPDVLVHWLVAVEGERAIACAGVIDVGDDACVTAVATVPERRGDGLASIIVARLLAGAAERGLSTATLQASRAGAPVYERLGFRDVGNTEMWERRHG